MTVLITLARVTYRKQSFKKSIIQLNKNMELQTNSGSIFDRQITPGADTWYWFAFDNAQHEIIDMQLAVDGLELAKNLTCKHHNLVNATKELTESFESLTREQRNYVLQAAGVALTGIWTVINGVQTVNSLLAWEPVNFCAGVVMTAATGAYTYFQYENLTDRQKSAVDAVKRFEAALNVFHATIKAYAPDSMSEYDVASPAFNGLAHHVYKVLPKMDVESFEKNAPNWSVA